MLKVTFQVRYFRKVYSLVHGFASRHVLPSSGSGVNYYYSTLFVSVYANNYNNKSGNSNCKKNNNFLTILIILKTQIILIITMIITLRERLNIKAFVKLKQTFFFSILPLFTFSVFTHLEKNFSNMYFSIFPLLFFFVLNYK